MTARARKPGGAPPAPPATPPAATVLEHPAELAHPIQQNLLAPTKPPTVARVVELYLEDLRNRGCARGTLESYGAALRWFAEVLPPFPTPGQVQHALQQRINLPADNRRRLGEATANNYKKYLAAAYDNARNHWATVLVRDPTNFRNWKVPRREPRAMANPQATFRHLLAHACKSDTERALLCVLGLLGLRISEARGLRWDKDLSKDWRKLTVQRQRIARRKGEVALKTEASFASFDVPEALKGFLRGAWKERQAALAGNSPWARRDALSPYMFNYGQDRLQQLMERIREQAPEDFPRKSSTRGALAFHCFRDTLGATLAAMDTDLMDGQKAMRHANPKTTGGYFMNMKGRPTSNAALLGAQALLAGALPTADKKGGLHVVK
jgi:integrase